MLAAGLTKVLGMELCHKGEGQYSCSIVELFRKGNELEIKGKKVIEGPLPKILEGLPKELPTALVLSGKGIVHKNIVLEENLADEAVPFRWAFPVIDSNDFYVQQIKQDSNACLSIARRDFLDELLAKMTRAGLPIYSVSFGGPVAIHILPQLNNYGAEAVFDGHHFVLAAKRFQSYHFNAELSAEFQMKIGEEPIAEELIVAYASGFQLLLHEQLPMVIANVDVVNKGFEKLLGNQLWKKRMLVFLFAIFAMLLMSFAMFSHYNQQNERLLREVGAQTSSAEQMELLQQQIVKQEKLLKQLNWNGGYNYGFIINEIGSSMPRPLTLLSISMNDFKTEAEKVDRLPNIKIKGLTSNLTAMNNWIFVLKEKPWVKQAKLLKFKEEDGDIYQFDILVNY